MQNKTLFFMGMLIMLVFASCKKESAAPSGVSIEGDWVGKSSVLSGPFENHYSFTIKAGGVLERVNAAGQKIGQGTWAFYSDNTAITGTYTLLPPDTATFSVIANFNKSTGKLDGTWGRGANDYNGGYWYMNKVK